MARIKQLFFIPQKFIVKLFRLIFKVKSGLYLLI